ncbi:bile acid:sodium symporter family protein [Aquisediminimonas profunda]|uniref:bile acid:sodium symporter family protein n=1 Tax=Aquisediminimonas profunda TaxID=1550733 RepID=UPI001C62C695|nr:bile acid:sodium symporter [Aquisediminimonas profunda]
MTSAVELLGLWVPSLMPYILALLMGGVGLSVSLTQLAESAIRWRLLAAVTVSMQLVLPLFVLCAVTMSGLSPAIAIGTVVLASCPGGLFSNYLTAVARANTALSITLTTYTTIIYTFTAPFWAWVAMSQFALKDMSPLVDYQPINVFVSLLLSVLLPVLGGSTLRSWRPTFADRFGPAVTNFGATMLIVAYAALTYRNSDEIERSLQEAIAPVIGFLLISVLMSLVLAKLMKLNGADSAALSIEHVVRQEGTGIMIVASFIGVPLAALPMLLSSLLGLAVAVLIVFASRLGAWQPNRQQV